MKNFFLRCITGLLYIAVVTAALFTTMPIFLAVFGIIMLLALNEFYKNLKIKGLSVDVVLSNALAVSIYAMPIMKYYNESLFPTMLSTLPLVIFFALAIFAVELLRDEEEPFHRIAFSFCGIVYVVLPFTLLAYYKIDNAMIDAGFGSSLMIFMLFLFTWSNDSFAYCWGMLLGKHPLCPKISPKKTIEGFVGGLLSTVILAVIIALNVKVNGTIAEFVGGAVLIVLCSTLGDMVESKFKRYIGVKDTGKMLPGHGGFLDRFDSVLFSIPAIYAYWNLFA